MKAKLTYILLLLGILGAKGQSITATLDSINILVGDQVHFHIKAMVPKGMNWLLPQFSDTLVSGIDILEMAGPDTNYQSDSITEITLDLLITAFDSAYFVIPPIPMQVWNSGDTSKMMVWSDANLLSVYTMPVDLQKGYFDIKKPLRFPITWREALKYGIIGLVVAVLLLMILYIISRLSKGKSIIPSFRKADPPHVVALRELEKLRVEQLWQKGEVKEFYVRLSHILREYIERQFKLPAMESTSDEIRELFRSNSVLAGLDVGLDAFFERSDMVKFAKAQPLPDEHSQSFSAVETFVTNTMPVEDTEQREDKKGVAK